jgi:hypothetical protein
MDHRRRNRSLYLERLHSHGHDAGARTCFGPTAMSVSTPGRPDEPRQVALPGFLLVRHRSLEGDYGTQRTKTVMSGWRRMSRASRSGSWTRSPVALCLWPCACAGHRRDSTDCAGSACCTGGSRRAGDTRCARRAGGSDRTDGTNGRDRAGWSRSHCGDVHKKARWNRCPDQRRKGECNPRTGALRVTPWAQLGRADSTRVNSEAYLDLVPVNSCWKRVTGEASIN